MPFATSYASEDFERLSPADRSLVRELVGGVVRHLSLIDYWLALISSRPLDEVDPEILWVLRISLYQIHWLRVPDYASVDEAVRLTRALGHGHAAAFVNAVLRGFLRSRPQEPSVDSVRGLATRYSHPEWLVQRWAARFGFGPTEDILRRDNALPPSVVRVNTFRISTSQFLSRLAAEDIPSRPVEGLPDCIEVDHRGFVRHELYRQGFCFFMDVSSQRVAYLGDPGSARYVADLCAAPGGKSFILASRIRPGTVQICADIDRGRLAGMRDRARELGVGPLHFVEADATSEPLPEGRFGLILADVPCSGLGTLRSNPDIKWFVREGDLLRWQHRQRRILQEAFRALEPGGEVVYSTCSTEPEENEQVVEALLGMDARARLRGEYWRSFPGDGPGDGFFAARIGRC